jgi:uncharacterized protein (TIGR02444 family)
MSDQEDFWNFSLAVYEPARENCLRLQDDFNLDVNILLFCCWSGARAVTLGEPAFERVTSATNVWRDNVVEPLRATRRWLKTADGPTGADDLRDGILRLELEGERLLQALIIANAQEHTSPARPSSKVAAMVARRNLETYDRFARPGKVARPMALFADLVAGIFDTIVQGAIVEPVGGGERPIQDRQVSGSEPK